MAIEVVETVASAAVDAELRRLREQVAELQKRGTELVEVNRGLKAMLAQAEESIDEFLRNGGRKS